MVQAMSSESRSGKEPVLMAHRHQGVSREHDEHQRDELLLDRYSEVLSHPGFSQSLPQPLDSQLHRGFQKSGFSTVSGWTWGCGFAWSPAALLHGGNRGTDPYRNVATTEHPGICHFVTAVRVEVGKGSWVFLVFRESTIYSPA